MDPADWREDMMVELGDRRRYENTNILVETLSGKVWWQYENTMVLDGGLMLCHPNRNSMCQTIFVNEKYFGAIFKEEFDDKQLPGRECINLYRKAEDDMTWTTPFHSVI